MRRVLIFTNPEVSQPRRVLFHQSGRVFFCQSKRVPYYRSGRFHFVGPEGSQFYQFGLVPNLKGPFLPIRKGPSQEGSSFHQSGRVFFCQSRRIPFLPIRKVSFCRTGRFPILPIRRDTVFGDPKKSQFHRSGRLPLLKIRKESNFGNPEGSQTVCVLLSYLKGPTLANPEGSQTGRVPISSIRMGPYSPIPKGHKINPSLSVNVSAKPEASEKQPISYVKRKNRHGKAKQDI